MDRLAQTARRAALLGIAVSAALAALKITVGLRAHSTAVVSDGIESAGDVLTSGIVLLGLILASRPADEEHPYGHGRFETLSALLVGAILFGSGSLICIGSLHGVTAPARPPASFAVWPLVVSLVAKTLLWSWKRSLGRRVRSDALLADASNDAVDILSAAVALTGLSVTLFDPVRFRASDNVGGFGVGLVVVGLSLRIVRDTVSQLVDTMPAEQMLAEIRHIALEVPGALGIEKCFARKTGFHYHVDLHLEVDPDLTVRASHAIATQVRIAIKENLDWVADVLVHVEPSPLDTMRRDGCEGPSALQPHDGK